MVQNFSTVLIYIGIFDCEFTHAPYFVEMYNSLSVWSCQGMEKSHYAAKEANR
jgi:hypothetical protein